MFIDERTYTVVGINGYRSGSMTHAEAVALAAKMQQEMRAAGWRGDMKVFYRDGTEVDWKAVLKRWGKQGGNA